MNPPVPSPALVPAHPPDLDPAPAPPEIEPEIEDNGGMAVEPQEEVEDDDEDPSLARDIALIVKLMPYRTYEEIQAYLRPHIHKPSRGQVQDRFYCRATLDLITLMHTKCIRTHSHIAK